MEKSLEEMAIEARRAYYRNWYAKNKDKIRAAQEEYWKRKAQEQLDAEQGTEANE